MSETRVLTEYEQSMLRPLIEQYSQAQQALQMGVNLLGGEEWRGCAFDSQSMTFVRPPAEPMAERAEAQTTEP